MVVWGRRVTGKALHKRLLGFLAVTVEVVGTAAKAQALRGGHVGGFDFGQGSSVGKPRMMT